MTHINSYHKIGALQDGRNCMDLCMSALVDHFAGLAILADRKAAIANAYDALAVGGFLRASGYTEASYTIVRSDIGSTTHWTI